MTAPYQPSILDRVIGRLFPTAQYTGLLDPGAQRSVQQQGLLSLGAGLLQAGAPHPYQAGTLGNLGAALQQNQMNFPQMAQQALQIQAYKSQVAEQQAIANVAAEFPAQPGETPQQRYDRQIKILDRLMSIPGGAPLAEKFAPVVAATKPDKLGEPQKVEGVENRLGRPGIGTPGTFLIHYPGEPSAAWEFVPKGPGSGKEPIRIDNVRDPGSGAIGTRLLDPVTLKPVGFVPQVQKGGNAGAALTGQEARAAAQRLLESHLTGSQLEQQNVVPSTAAAAIGGVVQKIAGERAGQGVTTALRGSNTNAEQQAAGRWADAYLSLTPKGRAGSPALRDQIIRTYWPGEGDTPATVALKAIARKAATAALVRAVATGTAPGLPGFEPPEVATP